MAKGNRSYHKPQRQLRKELATKASSKNRVNGGYKGASKTAAPGHRQNPKYGRQLNGSYKARDGKYFSSMRAMWRHEELSGKGHGLKESTKKSYSSRLGQMMDWMQKIAGVHHQDHIKKQHLIAYTKHLKTRSSRKGEDGAGIKEQFRGAMCDRAIAGHVTSIRWFAERHGIDYPKSNAELGVTRDRKANEEKPIRFPADWEQRREEYQQKLEKEAAWIGAVGQIGNAYGLRAKERVLSNTELKVESKIDPGSGLKVKSYSISEAGRPFRTITAQQMAHASKYKATFEKRLNRAQEGKSYLVVRYAKGGRVRLEEVYNKERRDALDRVQELCRQNADLRVTNELPTVIPYSIMKDAIDADGNVMKGFMKEGLRILKNTYERLGGTIKNILHTNADRHMDTQKLFATRKDGTDARNGDCTVMIGDKQRSNPDEWMFTKQDIIEERGHSDGRKLDHYNETR